jgi:hypothetical protein
MPPERWHDFLPPKRGDHDGQEGVLRELHDVRKRGTAWNRTNEDYWSVASPLRLGSQVLPVGCAMLVRPDECEVGKVEVHELHVKKLAVLLSSVSASAGT